MFWRSLICGATRTSGVTADERNLPRPQANRSPNLMIGPSSELPLPDEHRAEILQRLAARRHDREPGVPWEEVRARIVARLDEIDAKRGFIGRTFVSWHGVKPKR